MSFRVSILDEEATFSKDNSVKISTNQEKHKFYSFLSF